MYDQHSQALSTPPCPFRDRLKKALRLIRDQMSRSSPCAEHSTITDTPWDRVPVTESEETVVAAWHVINACSMCSRGYGYLYGREMRVSGSSLPFNGHDVES
jgi:hypothetical protein